MNKKIDGEKITLLIVSIVIIIVAVLVVFTILKSNDSFLYNNNDENKIQSDTNSEQNPQEKNIENVPFPETKKEPLETQISTFTSSIYDKDKGRIHNITLAMKKLNGAIVKKGEEFSFNNTIGPMGKEQGFEKALGFDTKGEKIQVYGGGMCQISSTLYNSVLMANLEVTERHPHSRRVYYVPKDKDATIYYGSLDFKFKNNTENDIKISASNDDDNVTVTLMKIVY